MKLFIILVLQAVVQYPRTDAFQPSSVPNSRSTSDIYRKSSHPSSPYWTTTIAGLGDNYLDGLSEEADLAARESAEAARAAARAARAAEEAALSLAIEEAAAEKAAAEAAAAEAAAEKAAAAAEAAAIEAATERANADAAGSAVKTKESAIEGLAAGISSMMNGQAQGFSPIMNNAAPKDSIEEEVDEKLQKISSLLDKQTQSNDKIIHSREIELAKQEKMVEELLKQEQELNERTEVLEKQLESLSQEQQQEESMWSAGDQTASSHIIGGEGESIRDSTTTKKREKGGPLLKINEATIEFTAGILGGVAGFVVAGPAGAAIGAAAANYACKTDSDAGDIVYNLSRSSIESFNFMVKFEDKYEVLAKAKKRLESVLSKNIRSNKKVNPETLKKLESALENTKKRMQELDEKYDLVDGAGVALGTIGELVERGVNTAFKINEDYKVSEKIGDTIKEAVSKPLRTDPSLPPSKK